MGKYCIGQHQDTFARGWLPVVVITQLSVLGSACDRQSNEDAISAVARS